MGIGKTKRERRKAMRMLLIRLLTSATLGTMIVACFYAYNYLTTSERFAVSQIEFNGLDRVQRSEVEEMVADLEGQNILLVSLEDCATRFDSHPRIAGTEFKRVLPNRVVCSVREREPVALVFCNRFLEVDREGMVMTADELTDMLDLPIITGLDSHVIDEGKRCKDAGLAGALQTLELCKKYGGKFAGDISELRVGESGISIVSLKEGMVLLLGDSGFEDRLRKFFMMKNTITEKDDSAKVIDLRFDDQIVFRSGI